jgi:peptidoglycan-N-acetylglucosamine deacetylase
VAQVPDPQRAGFRSPTAIAPPPRKAGAIVELASRCASLFSTIPAPPLPRPDHEGHMNHMKMIMRRHSFVVACFLAALDACVPARAQAPESQAILACWSREQLAFRAGEDKIRKGVREAFVVPPRRELAPFSPIMQRGVVRSVILPPGQKLIALTFDLCEQPYEISGYQGGIVDFLRANAIKATFFAGGKWMMTHKDRAQQLSLDPLVELGNHTWEHHDLRLVSGQGLTDDIKNAQLAYEQIHEELAEKQCVSTNRSAALAQDRGRLQLFRFPFGACDKKSLEAVAGLGLTAVQWDVSSGDPAFGLSADHMARDVVARVHPGSIVLFHANGRGWHTQSALPSIVKALKAQGYQFVTVSELLAAGHPVLSSVCYDNRIGDTDRYDELARHLELQYQAFKGHIDRAEQAVETPRHNRFAPIGRRSTPARL